MHNISHRDKRDILELATLPPVDAELIERLGDHGANFSYEGWAMCQGIKFYLDTRVVWIGDLKVHMGPYQRPQRGHEHLPYRPELCAGYHISVGEAKEARVDVYIQNSDKTVAERLFHAFLAEARVDGVDVAMAQLQLRASEAGADQDK